jgi:hypothetical protein
MAALIITAIGYLLLFLLGLELVIGVGIMLFVAIMDTISDWRRRK